MERKNRVLIVLIIVLSCLVIGLGSFIVYDKFINIDNVMENNSIGNENNSQDSSSNDSTFKENVNAGDVLKRITDGFWYNNGTIFFISDNNWLAIGKYASDGGHNGSIDSINVHVNDNNKYVFDFVVVSEACTSEIECEFITNGYTLDVKLEYDVNDGSKINITSMIKTEDGVSEHFNGAENTYNYAGSNWNEVQQYVDNIEK